MNPRPEAVLGHEESFFFALLAFLVLALWLWRRRGPAAGDGDGAHARRRPRRPRQRPPRRVAGPRRRAADDRRRSGCGRCPSAGTSCGAASPSRSSVSVVYFPAYWNKTGGLAQPARALRSMVAPGPARRALRPLPAPGEREPQAQHPRGRRDRQRLRRPDPLHAADHRHQRHRPDDRLHPAQRRPVRAHADGPPRRRRALWTFVAAGIVTAARAGTLARPRGRGRRARSSPPRWSPTRSWAPSTRRFFFYRIAFVAGTLLGLLDGAASRSLVVPVYTDAQRTATTDATVVPR